MTEINLNASIVDQNVSGIIESCGLKGDKSRTTAFTVLCMSTALGLSIFQAHELLTDGGNDVGVDGLHVGDEEDGEFTVTLFQTKYKNELTGTANFPENAVKLALNTIQVLFDPNKDVTLNDRIAPRIEEIRSMVRDGFIPNVRFFLCNNGIRWTEAAQQQIDNSGLPPSQISFVHFNHDNIVEILKRTKKIDADIQLKGKAIIEEFNFRRVLIGKLPVAQIYALFDKYGDSLLDRNIRRYLGMSTNRVNLAISETLKADSKRENFYFFNNGITVICSKFRHNALQGEDFMVQVSSMQVINGGQTCMTILQTIRQNPMLLDKCGNAYVLLRLYELEDDSSEFVNDVTLATNSQNPVDLRDLHANDDIQRNLELGIHELGYEYRRKRQETAGGPGDIVSSVVAEAVLAVWRQKPHQAKFMKREHFGKLYPLIFNGLNASQALLAVLIFRYADSERKKEDLISQVPFLPYSAHYIAMCMGQELLKHAKVTCDAIDHRNFHTLKELFVREQKELFSSTLAKVKRALDDFYGERALSLQLLSATFRRGDLIDSLLK